MEDVSDFHCVTTWSRFDNHWKGVRFRTIAELVVPQDDAHYVLCTGYDHMPGTRIPYTTNLPLARAVEDDVLLVHTWEGKPLPREHGGPVRMITPKLYAWKGTKWIRRIELLARNQKGFWEVRGYSDTAEPWANDRRILTVAPRVTAERRGRTTRIAHRACYNHRRDDAFCRNLYRRPNEHAQDQVRVRDPDPGAARAEDRRG